MRQLVKLYLLIALVILILCSSVYFIMRNSSQKIPENVTVLASESISQVETQATEKPEPEEDDEEDETEEEPEKDELNAMSYSRTTTMQSLMKKVSAEHKGTPVDQLMSRLNLLKY